MLALADLKSTGRAIYCASEICVALREWETNLNWFYFKWAQMPSFRDACSQVFKSMSTPGNKVTWGQTFNRYQLTELCRKPRRVQAAQP